MARVQKLGIDVLWREEVSADDENFSRDVPIEFQLHDRQCHIKLNAPRRRRLRRFHLPKELSEHPHEVVVIRASEDLGDKRATFGKELHGKLHTHEHQFRLAVSVLDPCCSDIGSTIVEHDICLPIFDLGADVVAALGSGDVRSECGHARNGFYRYQVDAWELWESAAC